MLKLLVRERLMLLVAAFLVGLSLSAWGQTGNGCIAYDQLTGSHVNCYYGTFEIPAQYSGIAQSRHTVISSQATDPNTGGQLQMIPTGFGSSVRLGNSTASHQAERIVYHYPVDTTEADLLVMLYAAVLQNPTDANHTIADQPKFTYRILDAQGNSVDSMCYSANFVADVSLGWNSYTPSGGGSGHGQQSTTVLWKDWTHVGLDLSALHGQTIQIELTTYDCGRQGHYGYAYFAFECGHKRIVTSSCGGSVANTFTAPAGFVYRWYNAQNPQTTLSTDQQLDVTAAGTYVCHMSFVGAQNSGCGFDMTAVAGGRFPFAQFNAVLGDTLTDCHRRVRFVNNSMITSDSAHQQPTTQPCEGYRWDFGDGGWSTAANPQHDYVPGTYQVRLIAYLDGGCSDTTEQQLVVPNCLTPIYTRYDTAVCASAMPLTWKGHTFAQADTVTTTLTASDGADSVVTLGVRVNAEYHTEVSADFCAGSSVTLWGRTLDSAGRYEVHLTTLAGCDSSATITLVEHPTYSVEAEGILCDGTPYRIGDTLLTSAGNHSIRLESRHGCDSLVALRLTAAPAYDTTIALSSCERTTITYNGVDYHQSGRYTQEYRTAMGCDSLIHLVLTFNPRSKAVIEAMPHFYSPEQRQVRLKDRSVNGVGRQWIVDGVPCSTEEEYTYLAEGDEPLEVTLISLNGIGCDDTTQTTIPFRHRAVWAPNVMTPVLAENNRFCIVMDNILDATAAIFTRQGTKVAEYDALTECWDGRRDGVALPQGSYVWILRYHSVDEPLITRTEKGVVTVIY